MARSISTPTWAICLPIRNTSPIGKPYIVQLISFWKDSFSETTPFISLSDDDSLKKPIATPKMMLKKTSCKIEPLLKDLKMLEGTMFAKKSTKEDLLVLVSLEGS